MELESVKKLKAILEKHNVSKYVSKKEHTHKVGDLIKEDTTEWELIKKPKVMENNKINVNSDITFIEKSLKNVKEMFDKGEINKETYDAVYPIYLEALEKIKCLQQKNEKN